MPNYKNGKVYKLVNNKSKEIYVGSTTVGLVNRKANHTTAMKCQNYPVYQHFKSFGEGFEFKIELLEDCPCDNKEQLKAKERYWIDKLKPSLNKQLPLRTKQEHLNDNIEHHKSMCQKNYNKNKEAVLEKRKQHYEANKERIKEATRAYRQNNAEIVRERDRERYAMKKMGQE